MLPSGQKVSNEKPCFESVRELMSDLIDYAGMFPPAKLPLYVALRDFHEYQAGSHRWILQYFLCPVSQLGKLVTEHGKQLAERALRVSVIGGGGNEFESFPAVSASDFEAIAQTRAALERVAIEAIELKLPQSVFNTAGADQFQQILKQTAEAAEGHLRGPITPYFEISFGRNWPEVVPRCIAAVAEFNLGDSGGNMLRHCGVKIRTGGVEAHQFPSTEQVALWIESCAKEGVAFKATAGLHHPIRHWSSEVNAKMHGFVNVFLAAALAHARRDQGGVERGLLVDLLNEENPASFTAKPEGMEWNGILITNEQIDASRRTLAHSYGSCSFLEPVEDLQRMGWLAL